MLTSRTLASLAFVATLGLTTLAHGAPAQAAGNSMCANADSMMMHGTSGGSMSMMKPSGNVDKDFTAMAMMHEHAIADMAKLEMECGKDAKAKAEAKALLGQTDDQMKVLLQIQRIF
ncbi:MAG: hypothetical protein ACREM2_10495 [Vulcanimicrobiaceae bacterium]